MIIRTILFIFALLLTGCASDKHGAETSVTTIRLGVIESVKSIEMDDSSSGGASIGSIFGQVGGASTGGGRGSVVGSIFGNVLGTTVGMQSGIGSKAGLEIWVKLDGEEGKSTYVMQPGKPDAFKVGDRVRVMRKGGDTRVEPATDAPEQKDPPKP